MYSIRLLHRAAAEVELKLLELQAVAVAVARMATVLSGLQAPLGQRIKDSLAVMAETTHSLAAQLAEAVVVAVLAASAELAQIILAEQVGLV